jgi:hypothetical protein
VAEKTFIDQPVARTGGDHQVMYLSSAIEPGRAIILGCDDPPTTWAFVLEPSDDNTTRS